MVLVKEPQVNEVLLHLAGEEGFHNLLEVGRVMLLNEEVELVGEVLTKVDVLLVGGECIPLLAELQLEP